MYTVKYGDKSLHDPRFSLSVTNAEVEMELNSSGSFKFSITKNHPVYPDIREHDMENEVTVYDDDDLIFQGTVVEINRDFQLTAEITCRGELAYLNDSLVQPYSTSDAEYGETVPDTLAGLFEWLIENHNEQVDEKRMFKVGEIDGSLSKYAIYSSDSSYPSTGSVIKDVVLNGTGAYVYVEHRDGERYISLVSDFDKVSSQVIDFGVNLLDFTDSYVSDDVISFVVPLGAGIKDTEYPYMDGYYLTSDKTPNSDKTYYSADKCKSCDSDMQKFEKGKVYYEKLTKRKYAETKDEKPDVWKTYYTKGPWSGEDHLLFFEYGISYYERSGDKGNYKYKKTTDKKPKYSSTYYTRKFSAVNGLKAWEKDTTYYDLTYERTWYSKTKDKTPIYGKDYYEADKDGSKSEVKEKLTSFDPLKNYFEYDGHDDESNNKLDISYYGDCEVEEGFWVKDDRIVCQEAVDKYGYIGGVCENSDLKDVEDLLNYGMTYLKGSCTPVKTLEVKAVDLAMLKPDYDPIRVCQYIRARSKPHGLDSYFLCSKVVLNLNDPSQSTFTLGANYSTMTDAQSRHISSLNSLVNHMYEKAEAISQEAKDAALAANQAVADTSEEYTVTMGRTVKPADDAVWSMTCPDVGTGEFVWRRTVVSYNDGTSVRNEAVLLTGESVAAIEIIATNGSTIRNNRGSTTLKATVLYGGERIEDLATLESYFGEGACVQWNENNNGELSAIPSDDARLADDGFSFTVSASDIVGDASYVCCLITAN